MDKFALKIICPDHIFYEGDATMVEFTTTEGNVGIFAKHIPMVSVVAPGKLTIHCEDGSEKTCALHSGFAQVLQDSVTIMADSCEYSDRIDITRAKEALRRALVRLDVAGHK